MMNPFYNTKEREDALLEAVKRWLGTPFRYGSCVAGPGGGVDCTHLCYSVHLECGAFEPFDVPSAPLHWHTHHDESVMLGFLREPHVATRLQHVDRDDPTMTGDLVVVRVGRTTHHIGTVMKLGSGTFILHIPLGHHAQLATLDNPAIKITSLWRITE